MKTPIKFLTLVGACLALFTVGCASHSHREVRTAPRDQFYCHHCTGYHPYSHSHYRVYYSDRYQSRHHHQPARTTVVVEPTVRVPVPPPPPRPPHPFRKFD